MRELMQVASRMAIRVHVAAINNDPDLMGYYSHERRIIVLRLGLTPFEMRSVLAHELAHAHFGDECSTKPNERRAERYAAMLLIQPEDYAAAEAIDPSPWAIAEELGVTEDLVTVYRDHCLQRLGGRTYGRTQRQQLVGDRARYLSS